MQVSRSLCESYSFHLIFLEYFQLVILDFFSVYFDLSMNTDHINYQQQIAQAVNDEKDHELIENAPKQPISSSSSNSISIQEDYQRIQLQNDQTMTVLTPSERRERIFTLSIIAFIALLTGNPVVFVLH